MEAIKELKTLGFKMFQKVGEGGFGMVLMADSEKQRKRVAIKIIELRQHSRQYRSKYLCRELEIIKTAKHPHIIEVHEIMVRRGHVFIVMEPAATDLHVKICELHHIPSAQAKTWFSQLVSAVAFLHQQDIVHRDLKCANVLLTADGQIKLTDFSYGRFYKGVKKSETFCCTPSFGAPEILMGLPYDPKKSDVWSLGVILYVMVTGHMPFKDSSKITLREAQRKALEFPQRIAVEESCQALISSMLQLDPASRPSVTEIAQHPWLQSRQEG
ncbi:testis-specific serine/threonine-protein kinase 6-like [Salminus brasiliensis]|uniref:testis-specific serine/threonine-protein kinase 6-like n=1 Tax=Salminus brasiliensis TaxID=930266 RepID=UPI003B835468